MAAPAEMRRISTRQQPQPHTGVTTGDLHVSTLVNSRGNDDELPPSCFPLSFF